MFNNDQFFYVRSQSPATSKFRDHPQMHSKALPQYLTTLTSTVNSTAKQHINAMFDGWCGGCLCHYIWIPIFTKFQFLHAAYVIIWIILEYIQNVSLCQNREAAILLLPC